MSPSSLRMQRVLAWALLFVLAAVSFGSSIANGFALDDIVHIVDNSELRNWKSLLDLLFLPTYPGDLYRPLTTASYALTYHFFGLDPVPYHLTNLVLHALASVAVFELLRRLMSDGAGFLSAALWAVHPIHTEVVANVVGRSESLAAFFGILSLILLWECGNGTGKRSTGTFVRCSLFTLCALMSKESAVALLFVAPLVLWWRPERFKRHREALVCLIGMVIAAACYMGLRDLALQGTVVSSSKPDFVDNPLASLPHADRALNAVVLLGKYVALHIAPVRLSADYSYAALAPLSYPLNITDIASIALVILWLGMALFSEGGRALVGKWALWFVLAFLPTSNLILPIGTIFGERLSYVPGIGVCAVVALVLIRLPSPLRGGIVFCCLLLGSVKSWTHSQVWSSNESLHTYQIETSPQSAKTQLNYGVLLRNRGEFNEASVHVRRALEIYPAFAQAAYVQGTIYLLQGVPSGASHWFHEALAKNPRHVPSLSALGGLYLNEGNWERAHRAFRSALAIDGGSIDALLGLFAVAIQQGSLEEARILQDEIRSRGIRSKEFLNLSSMLDALIQGGEN